MMRIAVPYQSASFNEVSVAIIKKDRNCQVIEPNLFVIVDLHLIVLCFIHHCIWSSRLDVKRRNEALPSTAILETDVEFYAQLVVVR